MLLATEPVVTENKGKTTGSVFMKIVIPLSKLRKFYLLICGFTLCFLPNEHRLLRRHLENS